MLLVIGLEHRILLQVSENLMTRSEKLEQRIGSIKPSFSSNFLYTYSYARVKNPSYTAYKYAQIITRICEEEGIDQRAYTRQVWSESGFLQFNMSTYKVDGSKYPLALGAGQVNHKYFSHLMWKTKNQKYHDLLNSYKYYYMYLMFDLEENIRTSVTILKIYEDMFKEYKTESPDLFLYLSKGAYKYGSNSSEFIGMQKTKRWDKYLKFCVNGKYADRLMGVYNGMILFTNEGLLKDLLNDNN